MAGLINVGLTGILGHQTALNTTGNNITNANTPSYSRQEVTFESQTSRPTGAGSLGTGVNISNIRRLANEFINEQVRVDTALFNEQDTLNTELSRLDNLLGGDSTGLNNALNNFFSAIQSAAEDPAALPQRQLVLSEAKALVDRFHAINEKFIQQRESVKSQMQADAKDVSTLLASIAELNLAISETPGLAQGKEPNDLLDKRDEKLRQLSELMNVRVVPVDGGQVNVLLTNGQALVVGNHAAQMGTRSSTEDPALLELTLTDGGRTSNVTDVVVGGKLGGLVKFQNEGLGPAFDELGRIAIALSDHVNQQHQIGMDLEGELGGLFFSDVNSTAAQRSRVIANTDNRQPKDGVIGVEITNSQALEVGTFTLKFSGATGQNYELIDEKTDKIIQQGALPDPLPLELTMPGFNIRIESGTFQDGDRYLVQPTRSGASNMRLELEREEDLAFASPIKAEADLGNSGNGVISQGTMLAVRNPLTNVPLSEFNTRGELTPPIMVRFTAPDSYDILDATDPDNPVLLEAGLSFQPGISNKLFTEDPADPNYRGYQFEINGNPQANDIFMIDYNTGGISDNRNAQFLGELATANTMNGGNQSFTDAYGGLVENVGVQTRQSQLDVDAGKALLEQSSNQRESLSGVNLDEEAGRLIQYQAAYNASAQVMRVAQELFTTLLQSFR